MGIGGIGMSSLAKYFHLKGKKVAGYDLISSSITQDLEQSGIDVHYEENMDHVPEVMLDKDRTLIIRTPAVPDDHEELVYFRENKFTIKKRAEVLGILFNESKGIAIAGTHGKTSVTSMSAYILSTSQLGCNAFLGGILKNYNSNLIINDNSAWVVAEADEYDRSFLHLRPDIALVTWIDADHLDIYTTVEAIQDSFNAFLEQVKAGGTVILKNNIKPGCDLTGKQTFTYALDDSSADFHAFNIRLKHRTYGFDISTPKGTIKDIQLQYPGITNIENAVAASAVAHTAGVDLRIIGKALTDFEGVQRRFDIQYEDQDCVYIDDYAHHPRELDAFIGSVRKLFPDRKITGIFQPHLYSRTRDFASEFAQSLSSLDELILLDIYPAREKPIPGVSSKIIFDRVLLEDKYLCPKENLLELLRQKSLEVLLTMGAGDIDRFVEPIRKLIAGR
jgi:UDP-N-acetylmuramate--alanine ligase